MRADLKWQGSGKVDHHCPLSKEDLEKIQSSYKPCSPDPKSLQQGVWFYTVMFHLISRSRENLRLLKNESSAVLDTAEKMFVRQVLDELDKNNRANNQPEELNLSQKYINYFLMAGSLLDGYNIAAPQIMHVSGHTESESSIHSHFSRLSEVKQKESPMLSVVTINARDRIR